MDPGVADYLVGDVIPGLLLVDCRYQVSRYAFNAASRVFHASF